MKQDPFCLIPDPYNPRPGEIIDEEWIKINLKLNTENSLCRISSDNEYIIPDYADLNLDYNEKLEESYTFLRSLAFSLINDGLIEPIEIFLADRKNDPDYFLHSELDYGYVILEGHQRRLAAMMAGVATVTCIEITDESMLAKLKVKHRKLRRQLSENNLRKGLSVSQNFLIAKELLSDPDGKLLTNKELSEILGLNEAIISSIRTLITKPENYPPIFLTMLSEDQLTFKTIRTLVSKSYNDIETFLSNDSITLPAIKEKIVKARGRSGGATKKSAIFKVKSANESNTMMRLLLARFPEINPETDESNDFKNLEKLLDEIKNIALKIK